MTGCSILVQIFIMPFIEHWCVDNQLVTQHNEMDFVRNLIQRTDSHTVHVPLRELLDNIFLSEFDDSIWILILVSQRSNPDEIVVVVIDIVAVIVFMITERSQQPSLVTKSFGTAVSYPCYELENIQLVVLSELLVELVEFPLVRVSVKNLPVSGNKVHIVHIIERSVRVVGCNHLGLYHPPVVTLEQIHSRFLCYLVIVADAYIEDSLQPLTELQERRCLTLVEVVSNPVENLTCIALELLCIIIEIPDNLVDSLNEVRIFVTVLRPPQIVSGTSRGKVQVIILDERTFRDDTLQCPEGIKYIVPRTLHHCIEDIEVDVDIVRRVERIIGEIIGEIVLWLFDNISCFDFVKIVFEYILSHGVFI